MPATLNSNSGSLSLYLSEINRFALLTQDD
jgi:hypothetical protein